MDPEIHNPGMTSRGTRTSVSALLIVGLLIGVTVSAVRPGVRALHRDASAELLATRQIAQTLARAVRELTGADVHKPAIRWSAPTEAPLASQARIDLRLAPAPPVVPMLLEAILALPPPVA